MLPEAVQARENEIVRIQEALRERETALSLGEAAASGCTANLARVESELAATHTKLEEAKAESVRMRAEADRLSKMAADAKSNEFIAVGENKDCASRIKYLYDNAKKIEEAHIEELRKAKQEYLEGHRLDREKLNKIIGKPQFPPRYGYHERNPFAKEEQELREQDARREEIEQEARGEEVNPFRGQLRRASRKSPRRVTQRAKPRTSPKKRRGWGTFLGWRRKKPQQAGGTRKRRTARWAKTRKVVLRRSR